ncbi:MAG: hypothetical protein Tsb002_14840 [Wenzhouxiangellaceae bacterium]
MAAGAQTTRVLIVGDSWAEQQVDDNSHQVVFTANGYPNIRVDGSTTAISGTEAADWVAPGQLTIIGTALATQPDIDTVQLTLGGNDFLAAWRADMTMMEEMALQQQISDDLQIIINFILDQNPDIEIILSFYDYPNFVDTLGGISGIFCNPLFNDMSQPTPTELNSAARRFEDSYTLLAMANERVHHVTHFGQMQFNFGFPDDGIQPGDIPLPGDLSLPTPPAAMRVTLGVLDCFHLRAEGYDLLVQNLFDQYYAQRFSDTIFASGFE